jgi:hypothetical protein
MDKIREVGNKWQFFAIVAPYAYGRSSPMKQSNT